MSVFISYSSKDGEFVEKLSITLVQNRINVWLDKWAMQPGDSLIDKIQEGLTKSSFLLVVLSTNSIESEWCKKELNSGLMRELEEKEVVVIPILLEDCEIPLFLKEKLYSDFTKDFEEGFKSLIRPLRKLTSEHMGRSSDESKVTDFALNWGLDKVNHHFLLEIDTVTWYHKDKKTILLQITINGDEMVTERFKVQWKSNHKHLMKDTLLNVLKTNKDTKDISILCQSDKVDPLLIKIVDSNANLKFDVKIRGVVMGVDTGNDVVVNLIEILDMLDTLKRGE